MRRCTPGFSTTDPGTSLRVVARLMATQRVHAIGVVDPDYSRRPRGVVTSLDVARAVAQDEDQTAGEAVCSEVTTVLASDSLVWAAQLMVENAVTHLLVIDPVTGHPCGILSSLDVAAAYGS